MAYTKPELKQAYDKAKIGLMSQKNSVFISTILFSLKHHWVKDDSSLPTAAVDGINLFINPDFFMDLTSESRITVIAHEAWHVAFNHMVRGKDLQQKRYNHAADHVINNLLKTARYSVVAGWLCDTKYKNMSAEQVYADLPPDPKGPDGFGNSSGHGDVKSPKTAKQAEKVAAKVADIVGKAAIQSKMGGDTAGAIPGEIEIMLDKLLNPKLSWRTLLQNYMSEYAKDDYTFSKPNRRFLPDFYLPGLFSESLAHIAVAVDTSGSVTDDELRAYLSEIQSIKDTLQPKKVTVVDFDTSIKKVHTLNETDNVLGIKFSGRGGTRLEPVFEHFKKDVPVVLIVFSDLQCREITEDPGFPTIWIAVNAPNAKVNFGKIIHYETEK